MIKIINHFNLTDNNGALLSQTDVDFVNLYLGIDNKIFLDFNKILVNRTGIAGEMSDYISSFTNRLSHLVFNDNDREITKLLNGLHETNATYLGMSKGNPDGNSVGKILKAEIKENLEIFRDLIEAGNFDINTFYFGISNIGPDRISDIITSITKQVLIDFTIQQCTKHNIPMTTKSVRNIYNFRTHTWERKIVNLPQYDGEPIIFIPKKFVSSQSGLQGTFNKFINLGFLLYFKQNEKYIELIKGDDNKSPLLRKEFNEYNKANDIKKKVISQTMFKEIPNRELVEIIQDLRSSFVELSDEDLDDLIERFSRAS